MKRPRPAIVLFALVLSACADDPGAPEPRPTESPRIPVLGKGTVNDRITAEVNVRGSHAYTSSWGTRNTPSGPVRGNAVKIWNVSGSAPVLVDSIVLGPAPGVTAPVGTTGDVQVSDDGALLGIATEATGGSLALYSLADPAHPTLVSRYHSANTNPGVHTAELARVNGKLHAFLSIDPGSSPAQLVVLDLGDPSAPVEVLARPLGSPYIHDVFVRDSLLFTAEWNNGMSIWDIGGSRGGSPANPILISNIRTVGGEVHNVWWFHDPVGSTKRYVFVGEEGPASIPASSSGDIHVVDITDITTPREVAFYSLAGAGTHNFSVDEASGVLYAAYYNAGVRAIDVRGDLSQCAAQNRVQGRCDLRREGRELGRALDDGTSFIWGVQQVGNRVYASDMLQGLWVLDITSLKR